MVSQGAQTNGNGSLATTTNKIMSKSMSTNINHLPRPKKLIKTLSDGEILVEKKRATTAYIEVELEAVELEAGEGAELEPGILPEEAHVVKHKLIEEECFHENYVNRKLHLQLSTSVESSRDQTTFSSPDSSSSSGSYSLDFIKKTFTSKQFLFFLYSKQKKKNKSQEISILHHPHMFHSSLFLFSFVKQSPLH